MAALRVLAIAVAYRRVGYVYLIGEKLMDWSISSKAARSTVDAAETTQQWINTLAPEVLVTEKTEAATRKGERTKAIIAAIVGTAAHNYLLDVAVARRQRFRNKYEEAAALAEWYPEVAALVPTRKFQDDEPRVTVLFEALALAETITGGSPLGIAAAMG